jgi:hypothetical protein
VPARDQYLLMKLTFSYLEEKNHRYVALIEKDPSTPTLGVTSIVQGDAAGEPVRTNNPVKHCVTPHSCGQVGRGSDSAFSYALRTDRPKKSYWASLW